jgi:acyl-CoA thioester hydrolase
MVDVSIALTTGRSMKDSRDDEAATVPLVESWRLALRVYYEDTDFSGHVYHASYLRFLERARTEWLRAIGFEQRDLKRSEAITFAVRRIEIDYVRPAAMDDALTVHTRVRRIGGASIDFEQKIARGAETLVEAIVSVALLRSGRPARMPMAMKTRIVRAARAGMSERSDASNLQRPVKPRDD